MEYLIKVSAILILFYICYKILLNRETFFESNRSFLLLGLITAFVLPLIIIPKYIEVEPTAIEGVIMFNDNLPQTLEAHNSINIMTSLTYTYLMGVLFFFGRFLFQFGSLFLLFIGSTKQRVSSYIYVITKKALSPFSFFNWIVFNPNQFNDTELEQIITHEKVHVRQLHSIDILMVELTSIFIWFNPFIWFYKKDLRQNLEFIADKNAQATTNCKKSYQHLLLKTSVPNYNLALTNNFYNSLIKKRIVMLHKNRSNNRNQLKFILILPALVLFLMSFNTKEIYIDKEPTKKAQSTVLDLTDFTTVNFETEAERSIPKATNNYKPLKTVIDSKQDIVTYFIESNFTGSQLDNVITKIKKQGVTLKIKNVKRNSDNEITALKIDAKSDKSNANFSIDNDSAIKTIRITYNAKDNSISIGNANGLVHDKDYMYTHEDGVITIDKLSGKGSNVFVYSSDGKHDGAHTISADTVHFKGNVHIKDKNVFVIKDGDKVIELKGNVHKDGKTLHEYKDKDGNVFIHSNGDVDKGTLFINKDGDKEVKIKLSGNSLWTDDKDGKVIIKSSGGKSLWVNDEDENISIKSLGKGKNKIFISNDSDKNPLYIIDGKESTKKELDVDPNDIESINVLKGEAAIKKYGDKGKDGVIEVTKKKKKD